MGRWQSTGLPTNIGKLDRTLVRPNVVGQITWTKNMQVTDLTRDYLRYVLEEDKPALYENALPHLFEHYYAFWAQTQPYSFRNGDEIRRRRNLILERLPVLANRFECQHLNIADIEVVLFVGHGTSNGHAFCPKDHWVVWLPIETYHSVPAIDVFVSHELAHALHYQQRPEFYFTNEAERTQVFRQLVTEGIATLASKVILGISNEQAMWADYLPPERIRHWYEQCLQREPKLFRIAAAKLENSNERNTLFSFSETDDVLENRAGYYLGLVLIERYMKQENLSLHDLFGIGKEKFWNIILSYLNTEPAQPTPTPDGFASLCSAHRKC